MTMATGRERGEGDKGSRQQGAQDASVFQAPTITNLFIYLHFVL